jgi:polysaccharide chain length determinant protein (PEP-CTERM system associated)
MTPAAMAGVWHRRKILAGAVFTAILAGSLTIALVLPGLYRATATVLVERQDMPGAFARANLTGDLEARLHTIGQEILSRARLGNLMERYDLYRDLRAQGGVDSAIDQMRKDIQVEMKNVVEPVGGRGTTVAFNVSVRGRDPERAAQVANALASFYVEENVKIRDRQAAEAAQALIPQIEEARRKVDAQDRRINAFKARNLGQLPEQVMTNLSTLERLNAQLTLNTNNQQRLLERRDALTRPYSYYAEAPGPSTSTDGPLTRLGRLKQDLAKMQRMYSDKYPDVIALKAEIASIEQSPVEPEPAKPSPPSSPRPPQPDPLGIAKLAEIDAELKGLRTEEQRLRKEIGFYQQRVEAAPQRDLELQEMSRDSRTSKELYETVLKRYQAEAMERKRTGEEFRILDAAVAPRQPIVPNRLRLIILGVMASFGGAAGAVLMAERLDTSFHTLTELRSFTKVPVLACVPRILRASDRARRARRRLLATVSLAVGLALVVAVSFHFANGNYQLVQMLSRGAS